MYIIMHVYNAFCTCTVEPIPFKAFITCAVESALYISAAGIGMTWIHLQFTLIDICRLNEWDDDQACMYTVEAKITM